jgi:hypothetical protein
LNQSNIKDLKEEVEEKKQKINRKKQVKEAIWKGKGRSRISDSDPEEHIYQAMC